MTNWKLVPPAPHLCQTCAIEHTPDQPHNAQSLFYQYKFYMEHHRWPTWRDAMEHCDEETQIAWMVQLRDRGVDV